MPQQGSICLACQEYWKKKNKEPRILQPLTGKTINRKFMVLVCSHCDGDALTINRFGNHEPLQDA